MNADVGPAEVGGGGALVVPHDDDLVEVGQALESGHRRQQHRLALKRKDHHCAAATIQRYIDYIQNFDIREANFKHTHAHVLWPHTQITQV